MSDLLQTTASETGQQGTWPQRRQSPPVVFVERSLELGELTAETPTLFLVHLRHTQAGPNEAPAVVRLTVSGSIAPFICFQRENANWNVPFYQQNALFHELNHIETIEVPAGADAVPIIVQIKPELVQRASLRVQRVQATLVASLLNGETVANLPIHGRLVRSVLAFTLDSRPETPAQIPLDATTNEFMLSTDAVPPNVNEDNHDKTNIKRNESSSSSNRPTSLDGTSSATATALPEKNLTLEVPLLQATVAKDVLLWNRSELATQFSIQIQPNDNSLTCTDLDSGLMLGPGPYRIGGLQYRRLRFTFTATSLGHFHYTVSCINWRNFGNRPTLHIHCLSGMPRPSTLAVFRVGPKEASVAADEIDFGDVYAGSTVWREVVVRNCLSNAPITVTLDQESAARWSVALLAASEIPPKEERALRLSFQPPLGTHTVVAAVDGRFMERRFPVIFQVAMRAIDEQDDAHSVMAATATAESPTSASVTATTVVDRALDASPRLTESKAQPAPENYSWNETMGSSGVSGTNLAAVLSSNMSQASSINPNDGTNAKLSYRSAAWPAATITRAAATAVDVHPAVTRGSCGQDDRPPPGSGETDTTASTRYETAAVRLVSPTETTEQTSRIQRKVFHCRARVSESIVRVHPTEIHLGDCYIESVHTTYVQLVNLSDLPAFLSVRFSSTSVSVASMEPIIGPGQTYDLRIDFTPHRVNPDYSKQITVLNLRNPRNEHVVVIRANCVDRFRVLYHALFYRLATDRSTHVNELDYGTMVAGHPYIRAFQVRNLTDKRLILGFESPKRPRVELLSDPMFCRESPQSAVMDQELPVAALGTSRVSRAQRQVHHDHHDEVLLPKHPASRQATLSTTTGASHSESSSAVLSGRENENETSCSVVSGSKHAASMEQSSKFEERSGTANATTISNNNNSNSNSSAIGTTTMDGRSPRTTGTCEHQSGHAAASQQPIPQQASATDQAVDSSRLESTITPQRHGRARLAGVHHYHHRRRALSQASSDSEDRGSDGTETDGLWGHGSPVSAGRADFSQQILRIPGAMPSFFSSSEAEADFIRESLYPARVLEHARAVGRLETINQLVMEANAEATVYVVIQFHASDRRLRTKLRPFEDRLFVHLVDYDRTRLPTGQMSVGSSLPPRELVLRGRVCISRMEVAQPHINFGPIFVGEQRAKTLLLQNASEMPAFYAIRKSGSVDSDYLHFGADRQGVLRPFSAREVPFVFRPSFHGLFEECIWIVNLLDPSDTHPVTMKAVVHRRTHFLVYPPDLDFGPLPSEQEDVPCRLCWIANHSERRRVFVIEQDADHQRTVATALLALDGIESTDGRLFEQGQRTHHLTETWPCSTDGVSTTEALEQPISSERALVTSPKSAVLVDERARLGDASRAGASNQFAMAADASTTRIVPDSDAILDTLEQKLRIAKRKGKAEKVERLSAQIAQRRASQPATRKWANSMPLGKDQSIEQLVDTGTATNMALDGEETMVAAPKEPKDALASTTSPMQRSYQAGRLLFSLAAGQVARVSILLRPQPGAQGRQQISLYVFEQKNRDEQQCVRCLADIEPAVEQETCTDSSTRSQKTAAKSLPSMQPNAASTSSSRTAGSSSEEAGRSKGAHTTSSTRNEAESVINDSVPRHLSSASDVFLVATATSASAHHYYRDADISGGRSTTKRLVSVSPLVVDFGKVPVGLTASSRLTIQNTSDRRVSFSVLEETRVALPATLLWSPMRGAVDVHGVVQVRLTFRPDCMGPLVRTLVVSAWVRSPNESSVSGTSVVRGSLGSQPSPSGSSNAAAAAAGAVESIRLGVQGMALARRALYLPQLEAKPSTRVATSVVQGLESAGEHREETRMLSWAFGDLYMDPDLPGMSAVRRLDVVSLSDEPLIIRIRSNLTKQVFFFSDEETQKPLPVAVQLAPGATLPVYVGIAPRMPLIELWTGAVRELVAGLRLMAWTRDRDEWNERHEESVLQAAVDTVTVKLQARVGFTYPLRLRALEVTAAPVPERSTSPCEPVQPTSLVPLWSTAVMNASMNESRTSSLLVPDWLQPSRARDRSPSWLLNTAWYCLGDRGRLVIRNPNAGLGLRLQLRYGPLERMHEATTGAADLQNVVCSPKDGVIDEPALALTPHQVVIEPLADLSIEYEWRTIQSGLYQQWIRLENSAYNRRSFDLQLVFIHDIRSSRPLSTLPVLCIMHSEPCLISASTAMVTRPGIWTLDESWSRQLASKQPPMSLSWRLYVDGFPVQWPCSIQEQSDEANAERWVQRLLAEPHPEGLFWESGPNELSYRLIPSLLHEEEWSALVEGALVSRRALLVAQRGHQWLGSLPVSLRFGCALLALKSDTISVGTVGYSQGNATVTVTGVIRNVSAVATKWRVVSSSLPAGMDIFLRNQVGQERQTTCHSEDASADLVCQADHGPGSRHTSSQVIASRETLSTEAHQPEAVTLGSTRAPDRPLKLRTTVGMVEPLGAVDGGSETIPADSRSSTLSETPSASNDRRQGTNVSEDVVEEDLVSLESRTAKMILRDGVYLDAGKEALLGLVLRPAVMGLAAGPFQLPVVIENVFQPENRLVLLIQGVYSIRLLNETNPVYLNEQGRGVLSIGIPEAAQGDVEVKWHVQLAPDGPYTDVTLQDRASGATLRSLTLASGEKFELQVSASTAVNKQPATEQRQARCGLCSSVDSSGDTSPRQRPVAWIELYLQRKQDTEACCRPERIPVYDAEHSSNRACLSAAEHAMSIFSEPSIVDGAPESAKRESVDSVSSSSRLGSNLGTRPLIGYPVAAEPTTLLPVPINTDDQRPIRPNAAEVDEAMALKNAERLAVTQREAPGQAASASMSDKAAAMSSSVWVDTLEEDVGPSSFRLHGCAHVGAHLYEMDAGIVPLRSQPIQRTLVIVQRIADKMPPPSGLTGASSVVETRTDSVERALEYKLHRIPTHWRRHDTEQVEWLSLDRMGGIIEPSRASQTITLTMQPHRLGLFREYLLLTDRKAPANLALIRVGMEVVAERTDASTIFQTSPMAIDYGAVMLHHVYRNKSIRIRNVSDQPLEFLLRHDLPSQAHSELHFSTSNLALRKVTSVWVEKGSSRRVFLYFRPEPEAEESDQTTTSIIPRTFHLYVSCRLVRDYEESVEIRCACHPPELRISTNDISFAVPSLSWRPAPTANLSIETLVPGVPDLYEVRSSALFFTVTEREPGVLCIQPRLDVIAELAPDERYIEEHCSVYNRRRPREFFWIRLRIKVGGDSAPEFSAALPRKRVFVLEETVSRFLCLYAAFWAPYRRPRTPGAGTDSMQLAVAAGERGAEDLVDRLRARQRWQDHDEREPLHLWVERIRQATGVDAQPGAAEANVPAAYAALVFEAHYCTDELVFYALRDQSDAVLQLALTCYSYVFKYDVFQVYMRGDEAIIEALAPVVKFWYGQLRHLLSFFPDSDRSDRPGLRTLGPLQALGQLAATEWSRESVERV